MRDIVTETQDSCDQSYIQTNKELEIKRINIPFWLKTEKKQFKILVLPASIE